MPLIANHGSSLMLCKAKGAQLEIAELDRLGRNVRFVTKIIATGVNFVAADRPEANKVMIQSHAVISKARPNRRQNPRSACRRKCPRALCALRTCGEHQAAAFGGDGIRSFITRVVDGRSVTKSNLFRVNDKV